MDGTYKSRLLHLCKTLGIESEALFLGHLPGTDRLLAYASADLFVLPSHSENFGIVVAEALAAGLPVITTDQTPWQEVQREGAGRQIPINAEALTDALQALMSANVEREGMSLAARRIAARYEWSEIGRKFHELYQWVLQDNGRPVPVFVNEGPLPSR